MLNLCAQVGGLFLFVGSLSSSVPFLYDTSRLIQPSSPIYFFFPFALFQFHRTLSSFHFSLSFAPCRTAPSRLALFRFSLIFFPPLIYHIAFRSALVFPSPASVSHFLSFAQLFLLFRILLHYFLYIQHTISCTRRAGTYHSLSTFISV